MQLTPMRPEAGRIKCDCSHDAGQALQVPMQLHYGHLWTPLVGLHCCYHAGLHMCGCQVAQPVGDLSGWHNM